MILPGFLLLTYGSAAPDALVAGGITLENGELLVDALAAIDARHVDLVNIMYTEVSVIDACLDVVQAHWSKPVGVYAHTGHYIEAETRWIYDGISLVDYAAAAERWTERGVPGSLGVVAESSHAIFTRSQR